MGEGPMGTADVIVAASPQEAIDAFGDGTGVTVLAGGTIVMPEITYGRVGAQRVVLVGRAGLSGIRADGDRTVIGAGTTLTEVEASGLEPLATVARGVADLEIREQATLGGNLCAPPGVESPRGDLQAALLVLDAQVRSAGADTAFKRFTSSGVCAVACAGSAARAPAMAACSSSQVGTETARPRSLEAASRSQASSPRSSSPSNARPST